MEERKSTASPLFIRRIVVEGLHRQMDVDMTLGPGLNVIYGKNGRGKTTMLHLLANLLELDFNRFRYIKFQRICVWTSADDKVEIERDEDSSAIRVSVNGALTGSSIDALSPLELTSLRTVLGGRATYLPAFRSVLERTRRDGYGVGRYSEARSEELESLQKLEFIALREGSRENLSPRQVHEEALSSVEKTLVCRQWFGEFVPVIRYPSISDVETSLTEEWRRAQYEITAKEQRMFEETFVKVFRVSAGLESTESKDSNEGILQEISDLLEAQELASGVENSKEINQDLLRSARQLGSSPQPSGVNRYLLDIYRKALLEREGTRRNALRKTREFENSVNKFLDGKQLKIGRNIEEKRPTKRLVSISTGAGHSYGMNALSSGERQIITMLYCASRTKFTSGMFLIDEPELSLHIDWQRIILNELTRQAPDRQIVVCTHSPEVGAEHLFDVQDFEPNASARKQPSLFDDVQPDDVDEA
ncbi:ATP-binding protein [Stenotrophomonas maltophilia]|nr:ATP-binding protein [Stenotrophomonas maltophilia]